MHKSNAMFTAIQRILWRARGTLLRLAIKLLPQSKPLLLLGAGSSLQLCRIISQQGLAKVLVVTDQSLVQLGLIEPICSALQNKGVETEVFDGVLPDPTDSIVFAGSARAAQTGCDAVLAVGGGSSIDAAKMISVCAISNNKPLEKQRPVMRPGLPLFAIPTTAGTGSEVTVGAVITHDETHVKRGFGGPGLVPQGAALDPVLMQGLPPNMTATTGLDALTHAIEAYIGRWENPESDKYAKLATHLIFGNLEQAYQQGQDLEAREAMSIAAAYAGFAINQTFVGYVHAIAHQLGSRYGIPHGLANAVLLPHILAFSKQAAAPRMAELTCFAGLGSEEQPESELAQKLIDAVVELNRALDIPQQLEQIRGEDISDIARAALEEGAGYPVPIYMDRSECESVLKKIMVI